MSSPEDANYKCRECSSKFKSIEELDEHMRKVHNLDLPHPCTAALEIKM